MLLTTVEIKEAGLYFEMTIYQDRNRLPKFARLSVKII
jgi:hypothetical protein